MRIGVQQCFTRRILHPDGIVLTYIQKNPRVTNSSSAYTIIENEYDVEEFAFTTEVNYPEAANGSADLTIGARITGNMANSFDKTKGIQVTFHTSGGDGNFIQIYVDGAWYGASLLKLTSGKTYDFTVRVSNGDKKTFVLTVIDNGSVFATISKEIDAEKSATIADAGSFAIWSTDECKDVLYTMPAKIQNSVVVDKNGSAGTVKIAHYIKETRPQETNLEFQQGDIVNTIITCAGGETILLTLDTTLPRSYSRGFTVRGTKGMYFEDNDSIYLHEDHYPKYDSDWKPLWGNAEQYEDKYLDDIWKAEHSTGHEGVFGHGGMDELMMNDFLKCIEEGRPMPIDVYDAATWMAISVLTEVSIQKGGMPVEIPDFTNGRWLL